MSNFEYQFIQGAKTSPPQIEKEVYEYVPDESMNANLADIKGKSETPKLKDSDTNYDPLQPAMAYEAFKHKSWRTPSIKNDRSSFPLQTKNFESMPSYMLNTSILSDSVTSSKTKKGATPEKYPPGVFFRDTSSALFESPVERITRIEHELFELEEYINKLLESPEKVLDSNKSPQLSPSLIDPLEYKEILGDDPVALLNEIQSIKAQLSSLSGDKRLNDLFDNSDPISLKANGYSIVKQHLDVTLAPISKNLCEHVHKSSNLIPSEFTTYELYSEPMMKPILENKRIISLESKISDLENKIGTSKIGFLPYGDISSALEHFTTRLASLDNRRIDAINNKIQNILVDLQDIQLKRQELMGNPIDDHKLDFLYNLCHRWKLLATSIPTLIKRLQTLRSLHQEASSLNNRLKLLEIQQEDMKKLLDITKSNYQELQSKMYECSDWAQRTTDALQRRIDELKQTK